MATNVLYRLRWFATAVLVLCAGQIVAWAAERTPPLKLLGYHVEHPVYPGGPLRITLVVQRDMSQACDLIVTRYIVDGRGFRFYLPQIGLDSHAIAELNKSSSNENRILLQLPEEAAPGPATYGNVLTYTCNPVHLLWPVRLSYEVPFEVNPSTKEK